MGLKAPRESRVRRSTRDSSRDYRGQNINHDRTKNDRRTGDEGRRWAFLMCT